jgi:hypothetical protein
VGRDKRDGRADACSDGGSDDRRAHRTAASSASRHSPHPVAFAASDPVRTKRARPFARRECAAGDAGAVVLPACGQLDAAVVEPHRVDRRKVGAAGLPGQCLSCRGGPWEASEWESPPERTAPCAPLPPRLSCRRLVQRGRLWTWGCNQRGQLGLADGLYLGNIDYPNENTVRSGRRHTALSGKPRLMIGAVQLPDMACECLLGFDAGSRTQWCRTPSTLPSSRARSPCSCHASCRSSTATPPPLFWPDGWSTLCSRFRPFYVKFPREVYKPGRPGRCQRMYPMVRPAQARVSAAAG